MSLPATSVPWMAPADPAVDRRLSPFLQAGVLSPTEVHVVDHLGMLVGERDPDVLLGLALAVRAPGKGHICVDLRELRDEKLRGERGQAWTQPGLRLPEDRDAWVARIARSPLVKNLGECTGKLRLPMAPCPETSGQEMAARPFVLDGTVLYSDRYHRYQQRLAKALRERFEAMMPIRDPALLSRGIATLIPTAHSPLPTPLDRQKLAAAMALLRGLTVISGGSGTGKTYTVRTVLALLWAQWAIDADPDRESPGPRVSLAAPTGKATARMKEAMQQNMASFLEQAAGVLPPGRNRTQLQRFLDSLLPATLHRLLRWSPLHPTRFKHNAADPIPYDVVVVDEASMVDLAMMAKLVDAVAPTARIILLGDQNQLSSVEAGTVLADLCGPTRVAALRVSAPFAGELREVAGISEVSAQASVVEARGPWDAIVQLERSRRFSESSGIGLLARACLDEGFTEQKAAELMRGRADIALLEHGPRGALSKAASRVIVDGYLPYLERLQEPAPEGGELEAFHAGVLRLMDGFRILCAHRRGRTGVEGVNEAVIGLLRSKGLVQASGDTWVGRPILVTRNDYIAGLYNGDIGVVVRGARGELSVVFPAPGGVRYVPPARLPAHETVFAMTIHKSQGSEFEHAMIVLPEQPSPVLTRELVYTGVTRARSRMTMVGTLGLLVAACKESVTRASGLRKEVWG